MSFSKKPLNGTKTHPLKPGSLSVLDALDLRGPMVGSDINPGTIDRLMREDLIEQVQLPSPFKTIKGLVTFYQITDAGREALRASQS